jgi:hypothetical protein
VKYRGVTEHLWAKVHLMCGVKTHIITAATILDRDASDVAQLPELLDQTAENFAVRQICADAAYNSVKNKKNSCSWGASVHSVQDYAHWEAGWPLVGEIPGMARRPRNISEALSSEIERRNSNYDVEDQFWR